MAKKKPAKARKPRPRRPKKDDRQPELPGAESGEYIEPIHSQAECYYDAMKARMDHGRIEAEEKGRLIEQMVHHGRTHYAHDGIMVDLTQDTGVKVKVRQPEAE